MSTDEPGTDLLAAPPQALKARGEVDGWTIPLDDRSGGLARSGMLIAGLFAGQHTSSVTSSWTSLYLHSKENRDRCLPPVLDEQLRLMAEHGDRLDYDIISKMDHLSTLKKKRHWKRKKYGRCHGHGLDSRSLT